ncbi:MAG: peptide chain release factor N(5)-glutamine methyltransferase [Kiritimatiellae bacterium]|nr:peptide chain release factor N(5)-glutamine methyltransferase [Kiritimatiellia bacterium]
MARSECGGQPRSWREILDLAVRYLEGKGVSDAPVAAELLAARLLKCGRGFLAPHMSETPSERYLDAMRRGMARLAGGEPVQYVLGEWDFRRLTLACDRRALIPRPETEELVTRVLRHLSARPPDAERPLVVDVGTGTGCIALALASEFPAADYLGLDISADAVALARENARRCGLEEAVRFEVADGLDDFDEPQSVDVIVSNPPYIPTAECAKLDPRIRNFEPMGALDGGVEGLDFYERLAMDALNLLKPGGGLFLEIGDGQGPALQKILFDAGFNDIRIEGDYAGHDRYASGILP